MGRLNLLPFHFHLLKFDDQTPEIFLVLILRQMENADGIDQILSNYNHCQVSYLVTRTFFGSMTTDREPTDPDWLRGAVIEIFYPQSNFAQALTL